jgi:carboxyl-terminal processing protease
MTEINNSKSQIRLPILLALAIAAGILIGASVVEPTAPTQETSASLSKFREVVLNIDRNYVDEVDMGDLVDDAIIQMLKELDPHTSYMNAKEHKLYADQLQGSYDGIGIQYDILRDTIVVIKPALDGPSANAGIKVGDRIVEVASESVAGINIDAEGVRSRLMGEEGSLVLVTVKRPGVKDLLEFELERSSIYTSTVIASYMLNDNTGYIKLSRFGSNSYNEFKEAVEMLKDLGMEQLVFDLQGNGGGYMSQAQRISDEMLSGDPLIVSQKGKQPSFTDSYSAKYKGIFEDKPVIILIDEYSASASEIVAGAMQDNDKALIVGRRSYGKGLVQIAIELNDGSELRLTTARYYTPSGRSIQKPYENGNGKSYMHDIMDRYNQGEFFNADSIQVNDSLKFTTAGGRIVYGGGGIMPDYFVPYDTATNSNYYSGLLSSNAIRSVVLDNYILLLDQFEDMNFEQFQDDFVITNPMLEQVVARGDEFEVEYSQEEFERSKPLIKAYYKAELARMIYTDADFYPVINKSNNSSLEAALTLFPEAAALSNGVIN